MLLLDVCGHEGKATVLILRTANASGGKVSLQRYRRASSEVFQVLYSFEGCVVERASVDEAYIDLTAAVHQRLAALPDGHQCTWSGSCIVSQTEEEAFADIIGPELCVGAQVRCISHFRA